ncbi:LPS export ABC transporter permease LptG [Legionella londiniensis]|uniref:Permease n=1 Tax=Legionella londiniensis TaxID=45068 RepID=A0A0W0VRE1_9GAMM|nr:LPS export ABC transporter permease LptG [Legionella londiniensis]KTD22591.1 hypothetical protein Llon_0465 [Legionella londiniensis]STX92522.1 permease [Legionella londiniensis]
MKSRLLERYIARTVLAAIGLVTLLLAGLQLFILFVNQLDDLGKANFGLLQAAVYVFLQMPYQVYLFFPMASLLGSLVGLGVLASHHELVVMRAAGMSIGQVIVAVLKAAFIVIVIVTILGETIVPRLAQMANDQRLQAMSEGQALRTARGVWLRQGNDFINIDTILPNNILLNVSQFRFNDSHHLQRARQIEKIEYREGQWIASGISETRITPQSTEAKFHDNMVWDIALKPRILQVGSSEPDEMTLREIRQYLRIQKANHQTALNYQLAFWQRLLQPITTAVMMFLAIPFIFGPLRSSSMGSKLLIGASLGFTFHIINRIFGPISQVFQWPVEIAAFAPILIFALLGFYLMQRVR